MRKAILVLGLVLAFAGVADAVSGWQGGYVYYTIMTTSNQTENWARIYRFELDNTMKAIPGSLVNVDNVPYYTAYTNETLTTHRFNGEIFDPREDGGQGRYLVTSRVDRSQPPHTGLSYDEPWDIVMVDVNAETVTQTIVCNGRNDTGATQWNTRFLTHAGAAPPNWAGTSNGLSLYTGCRDYISQDGEVYGLFDANGNGEIDNTLTEGSNDLNSNQNMNIADMEMGPDGALYRMKDVQSYSNNPAKIYRTWVDASGVGHDQLYLDTTGATNVFGNKGYLSGGIAIGPASSAPIVYVFMQDNVAGVENWAVFAVQDMDDDNVITLGGVDKVEKVWRNNDATLNAGVNIQATEDWSGQDIETVVHDNGDVILLLASYYEHKMVGLKLYDNGLRAEEGWYVTRDVGAVDGLWVGSSWNFEFDQHPVVIPEPGTLVVLGTGVLGVLGYIRRRRMR